MYRESKSYNLPWLVIGDFKCVCLASEKLRGNRLNDEHLNELNNYLYATGLSEFSTSGFTYTWWSGPNKNILTRIDRALANI